MAYVSQMERHKIIFASRVKLAAEAEGPFTPAEFKLHIWETLYADITETYAMSVLSAAGKLKDETDG